MVDRAEPAVIVKNVYKSFRLPHEQHSGLKQFLLNLFRRPSKRVRGYETQHVLEDISFEIKKGEFFGIVGRNGSGKSTLLKLLAGIYTADRGKIGISGSLTPFIELGVGFNPELTGRENVYLNGALLGFSHEEMDKMYDDIVEFAELEKFMDQRLKNYSSGMQVRLAFSIAIRANSDILLIDEVLAVGDEAFQRKCFDYFEKLKNENKTVVLITHDMSAVERYCTRAVFIADGKMVLNDTPHVIANAYSRSNDASYAQEKLNRENKKTSTIKISLSDVNGQSKKVFVAGDTMRVKIQWDYDQVENCGVAVFSSTGQYIYGTNTYVEKKTLLKNKTSVEYEVNLSLMPGDYFLKVGLFGATDKQRIAFEENGSNFIVNSDKSKPRWGGIVKLESNWRL